MINISEFVEILDILLMSVEDILLMSAEDILLMSAEDILLMSAEEGANLYKLVKFKISGEKSSQKFFGSVKKVNKLECSKNLSSTNFRCFTSTKFFKFLSLSPYYSFNFPLQIQN